MILTSQTSTKGPIVGHDAQGLDAQRVFLNTFENIINRRVNIPEDIRRFQKSLQYARSKVDYAIGEFIYMLPSDMNLRIGRVQGYNNKILVSRTDFKVGANLKINLDGEKDKPDVKFKEVEMVKAELDVKPKVKTKPNIESIEKHKQDVKPNIKFNKEHKPITDSNREHNQDVKMIRTEPDTNKITYEEEKVALVLGITSIFTVWWMFK